MDGPGTTFSYDELNIERDSKRIRLLKLLPSLSDVDQITCTLNAVDWTPKLRYAAISYVWGDPPATQTISINGHDFKIREDLHSALWHIRQNDMLRDDESEQKENLLLWADAICINQDSIEERNHQVALMSSIYGSASRVICWLGVHIHSLNQRGDAAIAAIQGLTEAAFHGNLDLDQDSLKDFFISRKGRYTHNVMSVDLLNNNVWQAIRHMFLFTFWKRVWIIQEIVLPISGNILLFACRNNITTWTNIVQFLEIIEFVHTAGAESLGLPKEVGYTVGMIHSFDNVNLLNFMRQARRDGEKLDAGNLPLLLDRHKATDPRDYVYGFGALIKIGHGVDYNKSKKEVYMDWFRSAIDLGRVDLMAYAGIGLFDQEKPEWPSWLPDLESIYLGTYDSRQPAQNATTPDVSAFIEASESVVGDVLHISGVKLDDTVERIFETETTAPKTRHGYTLWYLHLVCFSILANASEHPWGIRPLQAFLLTLLNCFKLIGSKPVEYSPDGIYPALFPISCFACHYPIENDDYLSRYGPKWNEMGFENKHALDNVLTEQIRGVVKSLTDDAWDFYGKSTDPVLQKVLHGLEGYTAFQTREGFIGIGPRKLKKGDVLCFLSRSKTPVLLREEKDGESMITKLVGACYMFGVPDWLVKKCVASGGATVERFSIR